MVCNSYKASLTIKTSGFSALLRTEKPLLFFLKFNNIVNLAVQGIAQSIQGFCANGFPLFDSVQGVCGEALLENQVVLCDSLLKKCLIKGLVADHFSSPR